MKHQTLGDTVYFWFAANLVSGAAGDGSGPTFAVRKAGASSSAAPTLTGTPTLLSHASYSDGSYEIAVVASVENGFEADAEYAVFCSLTISSVTPNGYVGNFKLSSVVNAADCNKIADHVRRRTQANVEASSYGDTLDLSSQYGAIQQMQESSISGSTLTVKQTDGSTTLGTKSLTSGTADPITGIS